MAFLDVITLAEAKNYLRIDEDLTDDDVRLSSMIKTALHTIEWRTNVLLYSRDKEYLVQDYCVSVYDYPINSLVSPTDADAEEKTLYTNYYVGSASDKKVTLNVGYDLPEDVPSVFVECALEYIKYLYYDSENNNGKSNEIPLYIENMINQEKRFIL
jgi:hypothetical protein